MEKVAIDIISEKIEKIILFGSRARGDFTSGSDWDIFVIIDKDLNFRQKEV